MINPRQILSRNNQQISTLLLKVFAMLFFFFIIFAHDVAGQPNKEDRNPNQYKSDYRRVGLFQWKVAPLKDPINTERPSYSSSPQPLPRGHMQIEGGYQFTYDDGGEVEDHTAPLLLLRTGLHDNLELQVGWGGYSWTEDDSDWQSDANDLMVGFKTKLIDQRNTLPTVGLLLGMSLPTGSGAATSDDVDPGFGVLWTYDIAKRIGLFGTILAKWPTEDHDRFYQTDVAVGTGFSLTDRIGTFIEYFSFLPDDNGPSHHLDAGLTYLVNNNLQLDLNGGIGLNERADDLYTGIGFAWRW